MRGYGQTPQNVRRHVCKANDRPTEAHTGLEASQKHAEEAKKGYRPDTMPGR
jgi:hypothetical protein